MKKNKKSKTADKPMLQDISGAYLYIPSHIYGQILGYVCGCSVEISGMGQLERYKDGYIVTKVHLPKQKCTSVETEMDADDLGVLEYECEDGMFKDYGELAWWWHSHVDMPTFWSGTDHEAMVKLSANGRILSTVFNRKFEMRTAYRQGESGDGFYMPVFSDELKTVIIPSNSVEQEINNKVSGMKISETHGPSFRSKYGMNRWDLMDSGIGMSEADMITESMLDQCVTAGGKLLTKDIFLSAIEFEYDVDSTMAEKMYSDFFNQYQRRPQDEAELIEYVDNTYNFTTV